MKKSTKKVVVKEEHKGIKLFGALINLFGLAGYAVANTVVAINSVARVRMEATNLTFDSKSFSENCMFNLLIFTYNYII